MNKSLHPKLTIITVTLNNYNGLKLTINSILSQKNIKKNSIEYLIIDGSSTDKSVQLIKEYENHFKQSNISFSWTSKPDSGIYNAMNKGLKKASGDFILFLNSGDYLVNETILSETYPLLKSTDTIYYADVIYIKNNQITGSYKYSDIIDTNFFIIGASLNHQNTLIPSKLLEKYKFYDETLSIKSDWKFFLKASKDSSISFYHLPATVSYYDFTGISSKRSQKSDYEYIKVIKEIYPEIASSILDYVKLLNSPYSQTIKILNNKRKYDSIINLISKIIRRIKTWKIQ